MTPQKARQLIQAKLAEIGLNNRVTAKTIHFTDLARASAIFVEVHDWKPSPRWGEVEAVAKANRFFVGWKVSRSGTESVSMGVIDRVENGRATFERYREFQREYAETEEENMSIEHTAGPWQTGKSIQTGHRTVVAPNHVIVADVYGGMTGAEEANARLIAAAPELLAELEACVIQYQAFVEQCCKGQDNRFHEQRIKQARAAIAHARGEDAR